MGLDGLPLNGGRHQGLPDGQRDRRRGQCPRGEIHRNAVLLPDHAGLHRAGPQQGQPADGAAVDGPGSVLQQTWRRPDGTDLRPHHDLGTGRQARGRQRGVQLWQGRHVQPASGGPKVVVK